MQIRAPKSSGIKISLQPEIHSTSPLPLVKNEIIAGRVLRILPEGKTILLIKGRQVIAKSPRPLTRGKLLSFKVENMSPFPTLKLLGTTFKESGGVNVSMVMSAVKENLWEALFENIKQSGLPKGDLTQFRALMNDATWQLFAESNPALLKALIAKSGLGWEAKLRKAAEYGEQIAREADFLKPPIDPFAVIENESGRIKAFGDDFGSDFDGRLEFQKPDFLLFYNTKYDTWTHIGRHHPKVLFTIGHELGHYFIEHHRNYLHIVTRSILSTIQHKLYGHLLLV